MIAYGARCRWWDDKQNVATKDGTPRGLPCCPHCRGVLFETEEDAWWRDARKYEADGHPGYVALLESTRGMCDK